MPAPQLPVTLFTSPTSLSPLLVCPACHGVLSHPVFSCSKKQHLACGACFNNDHGCKGCGDDQPIPLLAGGVVGLASKVARRMVDELETKCQRGCPWTGKLKAYPLHEPACHLTPRFCLNPGCGTIHIGAENLRKHRNEECGFERVPCERSRDEETDEYGCEYLRKDGEGHAQVCEWHRCTVPNCPTRGPPALLALHTRHCTKTNNRIRTLENDLDLLRAENEDLKA
ncbi:hypothetical protein JCM10207_005934 [Rhodosporidiobolus poonsookiae]